VNVPPEAHILESRIVGITITIGDEIPQILGRKPADGKIFLDSLFWSNEVQGDNSRLHL
jgi:hypothetical protein